MKRLFVYGGHLNFLEPILEHFKKNYNVMMEPYVNPRFYVNEGESRDTVWFEWADNNVVKFTKENADYLKHKNVIVRLHAVEAYTGWFHNINWSVVNHLIVVSEHIKKKVEPAIPKNVKIHVIPNAIDLKKWTYKEREPGNNIAFVGHFQSAKGALFIPHIMAMLPHHTLHIAGMVRINETQREGEYFFHQIRELNQEKRVLFYNHQVNLDSWYETNNINYILIPSIAESFNVAVGEAMAKGIKPIISNFVGAKQLWPTECIYDELRQIPVIVGSGYHSRKYRSWVEDRYDLDKVIKRIEKIL